MFHVISVGINVSITKPNFVQWCGPHRRNNF